MTTRKEDPAKALFREAMEEQSRQQFRRDQFEYARLRRVIEAGEEAYVKEDMGHFEQTWTAHQESRAKDAANFEKQRRRNLIARGVPDIHKEPWNA